MTSVEVVKTICKQRKLPISKLEKDLEYGNGYIGQLKKGILPSDRAAQIAVYLDIPSDLLNGQNFDSLISKEIKKAHQESPKLFEFVPPDVMKDIISGTYKFDSESFPQFSKIIGKKLEDIIAESKDEENAKKDRSVSSLSEEALRIARAFDDADQEHKDIVRATLAKYLISPKAVSFATA